MALRKLLQKSISPSDGWKSDEFLDALYWLRQFNSAAFGVAFGYLQLSGYVPLITYIVASSVVVIYFSAFHSINEEEFGGRFELPFPASENLVVLDQLLVA